MRSWESLSEGGRFKVKQEGSLMVSRQIRERGWGERARGIPGRRKVSREGKQHSG